jgi:hypothetical protein
VIAPYEPNSLHRRQPIPDIRQDIGIQVLSRSQPISHLAATHQVSRKFIYQQGDKAQRSLDESFKPTPADDEVLFHLPVTQNWLYQLILGLVLICHSSYRSVVELFRDLFDTPISIGTVHNRLEAAAAKAAEGDQAQDLSGINVGLHDEIYQANKPVLVGVDAASTYCYLLKAIEHRDEETWGCRGQRRCHNQQYNDDDDDWQILKKDLKKNQSDLA